MQFLISLFVLLDDNEISEKNKSTAEIDNGHVAEKKSLLEDTNTVI